jgi:hypothetical protein
MDSVLATTRDFRVCGACSELRGPFVWRLQGVDYDHVQECACARMGRPDRDRSEKWPGFDFNRVAELCYSCGCQVLRSGSRYSVWFCAECKERVGALNAEVGHALVPIGRHTIMNRLGLQTTPKPTDAEVEAFVNRCGTMIDRIYRLDAWAHNVAHNNLVTIGREDADGVALTAYLAAASSLDRGERFDAMVDWMTAAGSAH